MSIIRNINSITDLKRGSTNVNFVYRGSTLVWQRSAPVTSGNWIFNGITSIFGDTSTDSWIFKGINTKFR